MSRRPQLEPAWLIGLLIAWNRRACSGIGLGYYTINPMLRSGIPTQAQSYEPMGYGGADLEAVGRAIDTLSLIHRIAVMRYLRPWMIPAIDHELEFHAPARSWLKELRLAIGEIEAEMSRKVLYSHRDML